MDIYNLLYVLIGGIVGGGGAVLSSWLKGRSDERKQRRELIFRYACENFRQACEMARSQGGQVMPMDQFLIHMAVLSERVIDKEITKDSVLTVLHEVGEVMEGVKLFWEKRESNGIE